ncbi:hypothetical protein GQ464_014395 [Rhodocaloribacter litoris]|uniref:WD40/YVTN/BNR-like repeat-containing protein n=1 Tax=Rhodocaloribacter litoris TaxID=2558931 RepID=UPI001E3FB475|nr:FlgD immunoglobulin-like domain containing protein [Rhodocaloribacter litoris]QXD14607.1 hypothetical protein GQ464_014395 [Rhodocaloribacter litoris]
MRCLRAAGHSAPGRWAVVAALLVGAAGPEARGQATEAARVAEMIPTILSNSISNLHAAGDTLWVGPFLNYTFDGGQTWLDAPADSLFGTRNRVFSLDIEGSVIWVGLGFNDNTSGETVQSAGGFLVSTDGGRSFTYRFAQLDSPVDTAVVYGVSTLRALAVVVPQQSPPFDIDYDPVRDVVWVAGWASGLRRSDDGGRTWQRVVLPPDDLDAIHPDSTYDFFVAPQRGAEGHLNHMGFAVLVDETGTVWAGTPRGVNRSTDGGVSWRRFGADGTKNTLPGSWVVSIEEQPLAGRNPVWMATWNAGEGGENQAFGVAVTRDGGQTFEQKLIGVQAIDFAFRGDTVYVAGRTSGLFISEDGGTTWHSVVDFRDHSNPDRLIRPGADVLSVATTPEALWVGTDDGLLKSTDGGNTWSVFRVEVPLDPPTPTARVPRVETFAYPNPFSPPADRFVRIRYDVDRPADAHLRIFDFEMNLVRELRKEATTAGAQEIRWDGTDRDGLRVANGVYFYAVEADGRTRRGKILVIH